MNTETVGDLLVITLPSRMDATAINQLESSFAQTIKDHNGKVLVDMSPVEFVASLALRLLLTQLKATQQAGGDLRLCGLRPQIADVFRKSRFDTLFTIYPTREEGVAAFTG